MAACDYNKAKSDAYGNFEAVEIVISAEGNGPLILFDIEEGDIPHNSQFIGIIDTLPLYLEKNELLATIATIKAKFPDIKTQLNVFRERLAKAKFEQRRIKGLVQFEAITTKQLDDINADIALLEKERAATLSSLIIQRKSLQSEIRQLEAKIKRIEDKITRHIIINPLQGIVLNRFVHRGELVSYGTPLYKIAAIDTITLRAYIGEEQLGDIRIGQQVSVLIDSIHGTYRNYLGKISWISNKAEFTPKIIQTKNERTNLVYAFKVIVPNDGSLKIGMPAEVKFNN